MVTIISYNDIKDKKPLVAVDYILDQKKWNFSELKPTDLHCEINMNKKFVELKYIDVYLRGVYLFFDGNKIRYIGKAKNSFYSRFMGHTDCNFKLNFGWNALLRKIGSDRTGKGPNELSTHDHNIDFYTMVNYKLVLIEVEIDGNKEESRVITKLEKIMMRGFDFKQPDEIFNTRFGRFNEESNKLPIQEIIG